MYEPKVETKCDLFIAATTWVDMSVKELNKNGSAFSIPAATIRYSQASDEDEGSEGLRSAVKIPIMAPVLGSTRRRRAAASAKQKEPAVVARRNARERKRVKLVNDGFMRLRKHVPTDPKNKKLSKVKTLRSAIDYIHHLQHLLTQENKQQIVNEPNEMDTPAGTVTSTANWIATSGQLVSKPCIIIAGFHL